jgi:GPH family glycoside/pentoside/hexuronide:cation symporter
MENGTSVPLDPSPNVTKAAGTRLSVTEKIGFGFGDTASNILYQAWSFFLAKFYTDVFGLPAKHAAYLFLVARVWDMFFDPVMGMIADRTNTRWGKFRPYLLWVGVPYGALVYAMFVTPSWSPDAKIVYAYVTYILAAMAYSAINIPYSSMMAVITPDPRERTTLSQYRFFLAFVGKLLIASFMLPLVKFFGSNPQSVGYNETLGYSQVVGYKMAMAVFGAIATVLLLITFLTTRERVHPPKGQTSTFARDLKDVSGNSAWIILFIGCVFWLIHNMIHDGAVAYYFDYVSAKGHDVWVTWKFDKASAFMTIEVLGMMAGVFVSTPCKKYFGKKPLVIFFAMASVVMGAGFYVLPPDNFVVLGVFNFLWSILAGAMPVFLFVMFADATDFHEWKFGRRATGLVTAGIMFAIKLGVAIGGFMQLKVLDFFGYQANVAQSARAVTGIKLSLSVIPAAFMLICGIVLCFYPITDRLLTTIELDLKERKSKE